MIDREHDTKRQKMQKKRGGYLSHLRPNDDYPDIAHARDLAKSSEREPDDNLRKELDEIKSMLSSAKKDLAKYRCPMNDVEDKSAEVKTQAAPEPQKVKKPVAKKPKPSETQGHHEDAVQQEKPILEPSINEVPSESEAVTNNVAEEQKTTKTEPLIVAPEPVKKTATDSTTQPSEPVLNQKEDHPNISNMINVAPGSLVTK